jgi:hypothetical protein
MSSQLEQSFKVQEASFQFEPYLRKLSEENASTQKMLVSTRILLEEIRDVLDCNQKGRAMLLSQIADLTNKVDNLSTKVNYLVELNKPKPQSDSSARQRERTWT